MNAQVSGAAARRVIRLAFLVTLAARVAHASTRTPDLPENIRSALESVSPERILEHAGRLGSDAMEGRGTGTPGGEAAAAYLAGELARIGLRPMGDGGSYFQRVPMRGIAALPESPLDLAADDSTAALAIEKDYLLYTIPSERKRSSRSRFPSSS